MDIKAYVNKIYALSRETLTATEKEAEVKKLEGEIIGVSDSDGKLKAKKLGLLQTLHSAAGLMPWKRLEKQLHIAALRHRVGLPIHQKDMAALGLIAAAPVDDVNAELAAA